MGGSGQAFPCFRHGELRSSFPALCRPLALHRGACQALWWSADVRSAILLFKIWR